MPTIAPRFKFEYFPRGSEYSAKSEFQRFVTLDHNMKSYVGVIGVGVISGWDIQQTTGLEVEVLPGNGIIDGFFSESPYTVKRRSEMVSPDREVAVVKLQTEPEPDMTPAEEATYISVVQEYDPSFSPDSPVENAYVKTVIPEVLTVFDDDDTYIWVQRAFEIFFPPAADYPPYLIPEPAINDYDNYDDYLVAQAAYQVQMDAIYSYEWRDDPDNHFTEAKFFTGLTFTPSPNRVLIGKVVARSGEVTEVDTSQVDSLERLQATIKNYANKILVAHHHGGSEEFDPPRINLETDVRETVLTSYNPQARRGIFSVLESQLSGTAEGHKHTFSVDEDGNGTTVGIVGSSDNHFHKIVNGVIQTQEATSGTVNDHIHTLPDVSKLVWDDNSEYIVYVNGIPVGDNNSEGISANPSNKTVTLTGIIGGITKTYSVDFDYNGTRFQFSEQQSGIFRFMLNVIREFNATFTNVDLDTNPFVFFDAETQSIAGFTDLKDQSVTAEALLNETGAKFTFTPKAARDIEVTLADYQQTEGLEADRVTIELLGNAEVKGILRPENIFFINAQKITTGIFEITQIPFLSHVGRIDEETSPIHYPLISKDGVEFLVTPAITATTLGHYHDVLVNNIDTGQTNNTYVDSDPVFYQIGNTNETYLIAHIHSISNGVIGEKSSTGLGEWQDNVNGTAGTDSNHTHDLLSPYKGNAKVIYSMFEDRHGNIYTGTSDGLIMVPKEDGYLFVINDLQFYETGTDLLTMFESAKQNYENETGDPLKIDSDIYTVQIAIAETILLADGDSYLIVGKSSSTSNADQTMIQKVGHIPVPNFKTEETKNLNEVGDNETIVEIQLVNSDNGNVLDPEDPEVIAGIENGTLNAKEVARVNIFLDKIPVTSVQVQEITTNGLTSDNIMTVGGNAIATNKNLQDNFYFEWESPNTPSNVGVLRDAQQDEEGSIWVASNNGVLVLRSHNKSTIFSRTSRAGNIPDVRDILVIDSDNVFCTSDGIYKTEDQGKTWTSKIAGDFYQIVKDPSDMTDSTFYTTSIDALYRSTNSGEDWSFISDLPDGENGKLFAFGRVYLGKADGIYALSGNHWNKINDFVAYSFQASYDLSKFYVGGLNKIMETTNGLDLDDVYEFEGYPLPIITINGENKYFGYSYSNQGEKFYLNELTVSDQEIASIINFDKWIADDGSWPANSPYDIFVNNKLILSTKFDIDNRESRNWRFEVYPETGIVDFSGETLLSSALAVFDNFIEVEDANSFQTGDSILIFAFKEPVVTTTTTTTDLQTQVDETVEELKIENSYLYTTITSISGNVISFSPRSTINIETPAKVLKIPRLDANSLVRINVYDSFLSNIGTNTHQELEDALSYESDQRPYELNNSYLSDLLQLTQAVRYVLPEIDSEMIQTLFYDFHYSENPLDDNYLGNYIDIINSEAYSLVNFQSPFESKAALSINKILVGSGTFSGNVFVGTDIGVFWAELTPNLNANWFYVWGLERPVYDMSIFGEDNLLVATSNGIYLTQDMVTWTLQEQEAVRFPALSMSLRWPENSFTIVPSHTAIFKNTTNNELEVSSISTTGGIYEVLQANRSVKVEILSNPSHPLNGTSYLITRVFPNAIEMSPPFSEDYGTLTEVKLTMGSWWQQFEGEDNSSNSDLTNTLLVGGQNKIAYTPYLDSFVWTSSFFENGIDNVNIVNFLPLSSGSILASAVGNDLTDVIHHVITSSDLGRYWRSFKKFEEIRGTITSNSLTTFGHSKFIANYTYPDSARYSDSELDKRKISLFIQGQSSPIYSGKVIFNGGFDNSVVIFGQGANEAILQYQDQSISFEIYPIAVNDMVETGDNRVLFGTNAGIYEDSQTSIGEFPFNGTVWSVGDPGIVTSIDVTGTIKSISVNPETNSVVLSITTPNVITADQYKNQSLYLIDLPTVTNYTIETNSSRTIGGEITVEIQTSFTAVWNTYVGNRIKFVPAQSVLDVNFDFAVRNQQLAGGKLYVSTNENSNYGKIYEIVSNTSTQITLSTSLEPINILNPDSQNEDIIEGQSFICLDSSGLVSISVTFTQDIVDNYLVDFSFNVTNPDSQSSLIKGMKVHQNSRNVIQLEDFSSLITDTETITDPLALIIKPNDAFKAAGPIYQPLASFNNKITSTESSHYHSTELVGSFVSGSIASFTDILAASVTFEVDDTTGFNSALVQKDGSLFEEARIRFFNPNLIGVEYFSRIIRHTSTTVTVELLNGENWDFTEYKNSRISETWDWEIDATNYGYTKDIFYDDFITSATVVTEDINTQDLFVKVESTANMVDNDKILVVSSSNKSENNFIKTVVDLTTIELDTPISNSYFVTNTVQIKVLRDEFSNIHEHMIRNNQVETVTVSDYLDRGYPSQHTHRNTALIDVISDMEKNNNNIFVAGSSSFIYNSENDGISWEQLTDLNDFVEENIEVEGIVNLESVGDLVIAGTTKGVIFSTGGHNEEILPLNQPKVN